MKSIPTIVTIIVIVVLGAIIVTQKLHITQRGYEIGRLDAESKSLKEQIRLWRAELSGRQNMANIQKRIDELELPLDPPLSEVRND